LHDQQFQERQTKILGQLAAALVEATPEWWDEATLALERRDQSCAHVITSEAYPEDVVTPTDEIYEETLSLQELFESGGKSWRSVKFRIVRNPADDTWSYTVDYGY
jgi:hypothetical protein